MKPNETKPTIEELERIMDANAPGTVEILPNGEIRAVTMADWRERALKAETEVARLAELLVQLRLYIEMGDPDSKGAALDAIGAAIGSGE